MAPLKPVRSLLDSCIYRVLTDIKNRDRSNVECFDAMRNVLINTLHGAIRDQLIFKAAIDNDRYTFSDLLDIISLLGDASIKKINLPRKDNVFDEQPDALFSIIDKADIIGLHELSVKVKYRKPEQNSGFTNDTPICSTLSSKKSGCVGLHKPLLRGLAASLRVLVLENSADNEALRILGKNALHLTTLDINSSWSVDDTGISNLLFKDFASMDKLPWQELDKCEPSAVNTFSFISDSKLNQVCMTLTEVKIQDTNTSAISLLLLLMFVKHLTSLGGFLYYRNIGDAIVSVCTSDGGPRSLSLTKLWDTQIPADKLVTLSRLIPHLSQLYTRVSCLPDIPGVLPPLTHLTADFDFLNTSAPVYNFLSHSGSSLRRLTLIDQVGAFGLDHLAAYCPLLEYINAKVDVLNINNTTSMLHLKSANIKITSPQTFLWLMRNAEHIEDLEILLHGETSAPNQQSFGNDVIQELLDECPKSLKSIKVLSLSMLWYTGFRGLVISCGSLQIDTTYALCAACDSLNIIGELDSWFYVSQQDVKNMAKHIKKSNWNVKIRYKGTLYPES